MFSPGSLLSMVWYLEQPTRFLVFHNNHSEMRCFFITMVSLFAKVFVCIIWFCLDVGNIAINCLLWLVSKMTFRESNVSNGTLNSTYLVNYNKRWFSVPIPRQIWWACTRFFYLSHFQNAAAQQVSVSLAFHFTAPSSPPSDCRRLRFSLLADCAPYKFIYYYYYYYYYYSSRNH